MPYFTNVYDTILQGHEATEDNAYKYAMGMAWCDVEISEPQTITHCRHVETIDGIGIWYDYGADYYFFTDEDQ